MDSRLVEQSVQLIPYLEGLEQKKEKGRGAYGAVYEVELNGLPCIAKGLHDILVNNQVDDTDRQMVRQKFWDECLLLSKLKHPNIVQFLGVYQSKEDAFLVMEYMHMALDVCLKEYPNIPFPFKASIVQDVSFGLLHLHSLNPPIIHRDLTASNVLLTDGMRAKIADLGVSKMFDIQWLHRHSGQTMQPGTPAYMPPEALAQMPSYDLKLDIFSFGALMLFTATQEFPVVYELGASDITQDAMKNHTIQILKRKCWFDKMGEEHPFRSIVIQCLQDRPESRPTTKVLCENINSLCCRNKKEWKNILELHNQLQVSISQLKESNVILQSKIIGLVQQNLELQKTNDDLEQGAKSLKVLYNDEIQQIEKTLLLEMQNQILAFSAREKQLEEELHSWIQTANALIADANLKGESKGNPDIILATATKQIPQHSFTAIDPISMLTTLQSISGHQPSLQLDTSPLVKNSATVLEQELAQQSQLSASFVNPPQQLLTEDRSGSLSSDLVVETPQHLHIKSLSALSRELESTFSKRHPRLNRKLLQIEDSISLQPGLPGEEQGKHQNEECSSSHDTMRALESQATQHASTLSEPEAFSSTQQTFCTTSPQLEMNKSFGKVVPAERNDLSNCVEQSKLMGSSDIISLPLDKTEDKLKKKTIYSHESKSAPVPKPRRYTTINSKHEAQKNVSGRTLLQSVQSEISISDGDTGPAADQDSSRHKVQRDIPIDHVDPSSVSSSGDQSENDLSQHTYPISEVPSPMFSTSQSRLQSKLSEGATKVSLALDQQECKQKGEEINPFNDNHDAKPAPKQRPRASTQSNIRKPLSTRHPSGSILPASVQTHSMPAEKCDSSKCGRQGHFLSDLRAPLSSEGHIEELSSTLSTTLSRPHDYSRKIPVGGVALIPLLFNQLDPQLEKKQSDTQEIACKTTKSKDPPPVRPKPRHPLKPAS